MSFLSDARVRFHYAVANFWLQVRVYEPAANAFARVLRLRADDPQARYQRAWSLMQVPDRRIEAIDGLQDWLKVSPSASGYYLLGGGLQQESRHEEAVLAFREADRLDSSLGVDLYFNTAISLRELLRLEEAVDAYETAAHLDPADHEAWAALGVVLAELGRWKDAAPCQERAVRLSPSVHNRHNLAWTLYELKRLDEAERVLLDALPHEPQSSDVKRTLAYVLTAQDRYDEALRLAEEVRGIENHSASSYALLAGILMEAGQLDEAMKAAGTALRLAPTDPEAHGALGAVHLQMNDGAAALASFERMAEHIDPRVPRLSSSPWVWSAGGRGAALSKLGRHDEALAAFEELLRMDPGFFERWPELSEPYDLTTEEIGRGRP